MHVQEIRLQQVLEGSKQYRVPLYQRTYAWHEKQHARLWDDIVAVVEARQTEKAASHFTGSLVLATGMIGPGGNEFLVVDGQQRLTTLSVLIAAIRDHVAETEGTDSPGFARLHENFLIDRFKQGDARLKLLPTQADRDAFRGIIDRHLPSSETSGLVSAYRYFRHRVHEFDDPEDENDVEQLTSAVLDGLVFVAITAGQDDNVYRIFESLNNTGMKLTQGDLLRNYLFMRLGDRGEQVYAGVWLPMQSILSAEELESLFWMDLTWSVPEAKLNNVYALQEARLSKMDADAVEQEIRRYADLAELLATIHDPEREADPGVRLALRRLRNWGNSGVDPVVLRLLERRSAQVISSDDVRDGLHLLESFLVRRLLVNAPSNALSRILLRASQDVTDEDPVGSLRAYLSTGRKFFASDKQIAEALVSKPFYYSGRYNQRKLALSWMEQLLAGKEPASLDAASIEHVMPQTLTPGWQNSLSDDVGDYSTVEDMHEALLHVAANLTLTGYNSELSNAPFAQKRLLLADSNIALNAEIAAQPVWGRTQILERGQRLAALICGYWQGPLSEDESEGADDIRWALVSDVLEAIPSGRWTSYGQVAALIGTHPVPLGVYLSAHAVPNAWRVLQAAGTVSPGFHWTAGDAERDVRDVLAEEGIEFDGQGRASAEQFLDVHALARLVGMSAEADVQVDDESESEERQREFEAQIAERFPAATVHGIIELFTAWRSLGGDVAYGTSKDIGAFLMHRRGVRDDIWPLVVYSDGRVEVVFQWLMNRPPFDDRDLRDDLRRRLNAIGGIALAERKLEARPSFFVDVLGAADKRAALVEVLEWFVRVVDDFDLEPHAELVAESDASVVIELKTGRRSVTREQIEARLLGAKPEGITTHWALVHGQRFPVKQVVATALRVSSREFQSSAARRCLEALGFELGRIDRED
ncbi:DUF262 domain-containing protein [uncultured Microbacterium sp.]|uniref:GmrSD restriction endonuclease domain-containing protein n=1 Tax=uncultured Microbacterium sp. TaxID=191216 RepID=UPI0034596AEC